MIGMNSYFYTFKNGNLYRHNTNDNRNEYYGVSGALAPSTITSVIAPRPVVDVKLFKTLTYESNATLTATNLQTDLTDGSPNFLYQELLCKKRRRMVFIYQNQCWHSKLFGKIKKWYS